MNQREKYNLLRKAGFPVWEARSFQKNTDAVVTYLYNKQLEKISFCAEGVTTRHFAEDDDLIPGERETYFEETWWKIWKGFSSSTKTHTERDNYGIVMEVESFDEYDAEQEEIIHEPKKRKPKRKTKAKQKRKTSTVKSKKRKSKPKRKIPKRKTRSKKGTVRQNNIQTRAKPKKKRKQGKPGRHRS